MVVRSMLCHVSMRICGVGIRRSKSKLAGLLELCERGGWDRILVKTEIHQQGREIIPYSGMDCSVIDVPRYTSRIKCNDLQEPWAQLNWPLQSSLLQHQYPSPWQTFVQLLPPSSHPTTVLDYPAVLWGKSQQANHFIPPFPLLTEYPDSNTSPRQSPTAHSFPSTPACVTVQSRNYSLNLPVQRAITKTIKYASMLTIRQDKQMRRVLFPHRSTFQLSHPKNTRWKKQTFIIRMCEYK